MRVAIVGLSHESNTFLTTLTERDGFDVSLGPGVVARWAGTNHEVAGYLDGLDREGLDAVPVLVAVATPGGRIAEAAFDGLVDDMLTGLSDLGPFDGVLATAHGAAVSERHDDADGSWLGRVRAAVGPRIPIVVTTDAHANLSPAMLDACDALIAYRTNPHLDTHERGLEAADLLGRTLRGEVRPAMAGSFPPVAINITQQATGEPPLRALYEQVDAMRQRPGVLSVSIVLGFPYADVPEVGSSFVAVTDGDRALAASLADELAAMLLERRTAFVPRLIGPAEAIDLASRSPQPVCLLDMGDNIGGGSAADGTTLARLLVERADLRAFVPIRDPEAVREAERLGIGAAATFRLGGKTDDLHGPPLVVEARVASLHPGAFREPDVRHGGVDRFDMGPTAILETGRGLTIQVMTDRIPAFSLGQVTSCGLDPSSFDVIVAKGVHSPVPAYGPVCPTMIQVDTPGATAADMSRLPFIRRRRPLFPIEALEP
jgi:microcystin degradation protein MlrC